MKELRKGISSTVLINWERKKKRIAAIILAPRAVPMPVTMPRKKRYLGEVWRER